MKVREIMEENIKYVVCKVCGKRGRVLTNHIAIKHNMTKKEYEDKYKSPAVCYERTLIQVEKNKELNSKLSTDPHYVELMKKVRHENGKLPQVIEALQSGHRTYFKSDRGKAKNSEIMKASKKNPEFEKKRLDGIKNSEFCRTSHSENMSKLCKERWKNAEWKSKHLKKMFDGSRKQYTDVNGNTVYFRSSYELKIHNYLTESSIEYEYESIHIKYISTDEKEHTYTPDFYLPKYNTILEAKPQKFVSNKVNQIKKSVSIQCGYKFYFVTENQLSCLNSFFHSGILNGSEPNCF